MPTTLAPTTYLPLTTTFTPAAACTQTFFSGCFYETPWLNSGSLICQAAIYPTETCGQTNLNCYPLLPTGPLYAYSYSPGFVCPHGWTTALVDVQAPSETDPMTTAHCCPQALGLTSDLGTTWCQTVLFSGTADILVDGCKSETAVTYGSTTAVDISYLNTARTSWTTQTGPVTAWSVTAFGMALVWRSSDRLTTNETSLAQTTTTTGIAPVSSQTGSVTLSELSTGAKAGIGCGVGIGFSAFLLALLFFLCRRRKRQQAAAVPNAATDTAPVEESDGQNRKVQRMPELPATSTLPQASPESWTDSQGTAVQADSAASRWASWIEAQNNRAELEEIYPPGHRRNRSELSDSLPSGHRRNPSELSGGSVQDPQSPARFEAAKP